MTCVDLLVALFTTNPSRATVNQYFHSSSLANARSTSGRLPGVHKGDATTTARAAHFCRFSTIRQRLLDQQIHLRCGDSRRQTLSLRISILHRG